MRSLGLGGAPTGVQCRAHGAVWSWGLTFCAFLYKNTTVFEADCFSAVTSPYFWTVGGRPCLPMFEPAPAEKYYGDKTKTKIPLSYNQNSYKNVSIELQDSIAIAKKTARCAQYMGALKRFQSPHYAPGYFSRNL